MPNLAALAYRLGKVTFACCGRSRRVVHFGKV
jgi:hypothetical protein